MASSEEITVHQSPHMFAQVQVPARLSPEWERERSTETTDSQAEHLIHLLNRQERAILMQLCAHQLNRLVDLSPEALQALISTAQSSKNKPPSPNASPGPNNRNTNAAGSTSIANRAKSAFLSWGSKSGNGSNGDVSHQDITVVTTLSDQLAKNLHLEGLFRVSGNLLRVDKLREGVGSGELANLLRTGYFTQHDVASLLKQYLSGVDLIPQSTHMAHLAIANLTHSLDQERAHVKRAAQIASSKKFFKDSERNSSVAGQDKVEKLLGTYETLSLFENKKRQHIEALQIMFSMLSTNQRTMLKVVLSLLYQVAKHKHITKMSASNLATVFAPHFFSANPTLTTVNSNKTPTGSSSASVNLNLTCVENWALTCYAVTFMIRHWGSVLQIPTDLRDQVSNYLYARQNAAHLLAPPAANPDCDEKRARFKFMKGNSVESKGVTGVTSGPKQPPQVKQRSRSAHSGIQGLRGRIAGVGFLDKKDSYEVTRSGRRQSRDRRSRHLSPETKMRTPLKVSNLQNAQQFVFRNTPV